MVLDRMPVPVGDFISRHVYTSKLKSHHEIHEMSCVAFVDVVKGEESRMGQSWVNKEEVYTILNLVRHYYKTKEFCIITPYDAQRTEIQKYLKAEDLPWEAVYNVDSFQGHEAPYVIVSTVRTNSPGFLRSQNRMNVMLTRCQSGMVIVTNRKFLNSHTARGTLLGLMAHHWESERGRLATWITPQQISGREANLPGALAMKPVPPAVPTVIPASPPQPQQALEMKMKTLSISPTASQRQPGPMPTRAHFPSLPSKTGPGAQATAPLNTISWNRLACRTTDSSYSRVASRHSNLWTQDPSSTAGATVTSISPTSVTPRPSNSTAGLTHRSKDEVRERERGPGEGWVAMPKKGEELFLIHPAGEREKPVKR